MNTQLAAKVGAVLAMTLVSSSAYAQFTTEMARIRVVNTDRTHHLWDVYIGDTLVASPLWAGIAMDHWVLVTPGNHVVTAVPHGRDRQTAAMFTTTMTFTRATNPFNGDYLIIRSNAGTNNNEWKAEFKDYKFDGHGGRSYLDP